MGLKTKCPNTGQRTIWKANKPLNSRRHLGTNPSSFVSQTRCPKVGFLFLNQQGYRSSAKLKKLIYLDLEVGSDIHDSDHQVTSDKLKSGEMELVRLEGIVKEIVTEMGYLETREKEMRNLNGALSRLEKDLPFDRSDQ